ncbi:MAG: hypothetical protein KAH38_00380 [Candidatus Hydrogenedentes bacterium]|nr:hypothetical protein [Candidatus Hydrogenedentota bacterium]
MSTKSARWSIPLFCIKFILFVAVLVVLWWLFLPWYGKALLQVTGMPLKDIFGMPIESGSIDVSGLLNTNTTLTFIIAGHQRTMSIALLVTNLPPYIALVLATAGITWKRRLLILIYGCGILCFFHVAFIILALRFFSIMTTGSEIPTAIAQFFLTLPFMLWIVFAYWDKLAAFITESPNVVGNGSESEDK